MLSAGREFIAPGELGAVETASRGEFPLGFGRQVLTRPFCVGERIGECDVHDRVIVERVDIAVRTVRMAPVGALEERPPLTSVCQVDRMFRRGEDERAGEIMGGSAPG